MTKTKQVVRTRIAPSPTGQDLHIGNAYTALINYVVAKKNAGSFIVRIEDTDRTRLVEGSETKILESLHWLGLHPDESPEVHGPHAPYRQSERLEIYQKYATELIAKNHAFYCFCTPERLAEMRKNQEAQHQPPMYDGTCKKMSLEEATVRVKKGERHVIRLNVPDEGTTKFMDLIRGEIVFENKLIDDQVILKSDGFPTYHLGVVVDDNIMKISHIIRGEEWISSTPKHILLYEFFGWQKPIFAHMPLLRNPDKSKLSKRKNPVWVSWYKEQGFLPEAIINYLGTLAWCFPDGRDIFSVEEMMAAFTLEHVKTTAPIFDIEKLKWMNGLYIRKLTDEQLLDKLIPYIPQNTDRELLAKLLPLAKDRMKTVQEFNQYLKPFTDFTPSQLESKFQDALQPFVMLFTELTDWSTKELEQKSKQLVADKQLSMRDAFMAIRLAVTGEKVGLPLFETLEILGKEETLKRIKI